MRAVDAAKHNRLATEYAPGTSNLLRAESLSARDTGASSSSRCSPRSTQNLSDLGHLLPRQHALLPPTVLSRLDFTKRERFTTRGIRVFGRSATTQCQHNQAWVCPHNRSSLYWTAAKLRLFYKFITRRWNAKPEQERFPVIKLPESGASGHRNWTDG
jgi:hypothetical protein